VREWLGRQVSSIMVSSIGVPGQLFFGLRWTTWDQGPSLAARRICKRLAGVCWSALAPRSTRPNPERKLGPKSAATVVLLWPVSPLLVVLRLLPLSHSRWPVLLTAEQSSGPPTWSSVAGPTCATLYIPPWCGTSVESAEQPATCSSLSGNASCPSGEGRYGAYQAGESSTDLKERPKGTRSSPGLNSNFASEV